MSQIPPSMTPPPGYNPNMPIGGQPPRSRTSAAAVASLICGILCCIPFITPLLAVIFGIVGISATGKPNVTGRGLAIAGLILGLIGLAIWGVGSGVWGVQYVKTAPARAVATRFLQDTSSGDLGAATSNATTSMGDKVGDLANTMKPLGPLNRVTFTAFGISSQSGQPTRATLGGAAIFANGAKAVSMVLVKEGSTYKVESCELK